MHLILQQPYPGHPWGEHSMAVHPFSPKVPFRLNNTRQEGLGPTTQEYPWLWSCELCSGNAPNFSKLLHPVLQGQQLSCRAGISWQSLVTSNYNLSQGGQWGELESAPAEASHATPLLYTQGRQRGLCL